VCEVLYRNVHIIMQRGAVDTWQYTHVTYRWSLDLQSCDIKKAQYELYERCCLVTGYRPSPNPADWCSADIAALLAQPTGAALFPEPAGEGAEHEWELWGQTVLFLVHQFKCTVRFVDDLTCGHNSYISQLLYYNDRLMGGRVRGIYPGCAAEKQPAAGEFLVLEHTPGRSPWSFCTLDVGIVSSAKRVATPAGATWLVTSATRLYDKRMQSCYDGIPIVRYTHISSAISPFAGYNILVSQLHRFQSLITQRSSFVLEVAKLLVRMETRG
jgi:hypothetical protein